MHEDSLSIMQNKSDYRLQNSHSTHSQRLAEQLDSMAHWPNCIFFTGVAAKVEKNWSIGMVGEPVGCDAVNTLSRTEVLPLQQADTVTTIAQRSITLNADKHEMLCLHSLLLSTATTKLLTVSRFLCHISTIGAIQCHSPWFTLENTGQKTD